MAARWFGMNRGSPASPSVAGTPIITESATTTGLDIELTVKDTSTTTKQQIYDFIERVKKHLLSEVSTIPNDF
jgi:hypothetical protein